MKIFIATFFIFILCGTLQSQGDLKQTSKINLKNRKDYKLNVNGYKGADIDKLYELVSETKLAVEIEMPGNPLKQILFKYSPDAYYNLARIEKYLQNDIVIGSNFKYPYIGGGKSIYKVNGKIIKEKEIQNEGFLRWFEADKKLIENVLVIPSAVHEENHIFTNRYSLYVLSRTLKNIDETTASEDGGRTSFIFYFDTFYLGPGKELFAMSRKVGLPRQAFAVSKIEAMIPQDKRTSRYNTYVGKSSPNSGQGVSNLMDEYNSYYWSNKVLYDLYEYFRKEVPQTEVNWIKWINHMSGNYYSWAEFRYWIITYLIYARQNEPEIFKSMMNDLLLRKAFTEVDDTFTDLVKKIFYRFSVELPKHLSTLKMKGEMKRWTYTKEKRQSEIFYNVNGISVSLQNRNFDLLITELNKKEYVEMSNSFRLTFQQELPVLPSVHVNIVNP